MKYCVAIKVIYVENVFKTKLMLKQVVLYQSLQNA